MTLQVLSVVPRVNDAAEFCRTARNVLAWSEKHGLDGTLFFTGTGAVLDPWVAAAMTHAETRSLTPLVAVNPIYGHPFAAARMVTSLAQAYGRRVALNLVTGTALSDLTGVGDDLDHDQRYERLAEYAEILLELLTSPRPLTFTGRYYRTERLQLSPALPEHLRPDLYVAGSSAGARRVAEKAGATALRMLPATLDELGDDVGALHFGVIVRPTAEEARAAAVARFPADPELAQLAALALENTDSEWKRELFRDDRPAGQEYWLAPVRTFRADCPYVVTDYTGFGSLLKRLESRGIRTVILDVPADEREFAHVAHAMTAAPEPR